ncbi:hypothetical protein ACFL6C_08230 [Myxococcota bacterium]
MLPVTDRLSITATVILSLTAGAASAAEEIADDILALTGGQRVKIVWTQDDQATDGSDYFAEGEGHQLLGYDTADDEIRRPLPRQPQRQPL